MSGVIEGPVSKEALCEMIEKDALAPDDEVSSGSYWFSLRERKEVYEQLGVLPMERRTRRDQEPTQEMEKTQSIEAPKIKKWWKKLF